MMQVDPPVTRTASIVITILVELIIIGLALGIAKLASWLIGVSINWPAAISGIFFGHLLIAAWNAWRRWRKGAK